MNATIFLVVLVGLVLVGTVNVSMALSGSHPFLTQWGGSGPSSGSFYNPQNLALDSHGNVYVT